MPSNIDVSEGPKRAREIEVTPPVAPQPPDIGISRGTIEAGANPFAANSSRLGDPPRPKCVVTAEVQAVAPEVAAHSGRDSDISVIRSTIQPRRLALGDLRNENSEEEPENNPVVLAN